MIFFTNSFRILKSMKLISFIFIRVHFNKDITKDQYFQLGVQLFSQNVQKCMNLVGLVTSGVSSNNHSSFSPEGALTHDVKKSTRSIHFCTICPNELHTLLCQMCQVSQDFGMHLSVVYPTMAQESK